MSFILDALRKSEHERQRSALPGLSQVPLATAEAKLPGWALGVIGLLAAAVLVLAGAWWQSTRATDPLTASAPTVQRPVTLPPPASPIVAPPPAVVAGQAAGAPATTLEPAAPAGRSSLANAAAPAPTDVAPDEPSFSQPSAAAADDAELALPSAASLMAEGIALPTLHLELLRFREQAADRFVFINGRKYVEGERLAEGPQLVSITAAGAVLTHGGRRFLLVSE